MKRVTDLGEKIYLIVYGKPRYKLEISKKIYGEESKAIYPEIKKLEKMGWIKQVDYKDSNPKSGKRANRRQYYYANVDPLFDSICQNLMDIQEKLPPGFDKNSHMLVWDDIKPSIDEKKRLRKLLDHKVFRKFVYDLSKKIEQIPGLYDPLFNFSFIKNQFSNYCTFSLCFEYIRIFKESQDAEIDKNTIQLNERYKAKTNFTDIAEGTLSLGFFLIEKLTYLDYYTSRALISYLMKMWFAFPVLTRSELSDTPLQKISQIDKFLNFF